MFSSFLLSGGYFFWGGEFLTPNSTIFKIINKNVDQNDLSQIVIQHINS